MRPATQSPSHTADSAPAIWHGVMALAIALPWLNPMTWGPTPEMPQRLLSACCAAVLLIGWAARGSIGGRSMVDTVVMGWLLAALLSTAIGLLQYFALDTSGFGAWINSASVGQAYGNLRQRNQFASLTSLGLVALLYLNAAYAETPRVRLRQSLSLLALTLLALGNAASSSRTGALQWGAVVVMAWMWARATGTRSMLRWSLLAFVLYITATLLLPALLQVWTGVRAANALERFQEHMGCESRSVLWANVLELIAQKPWLGWGWGELKFAHFMFAYRGDRFCELLDNAHNLPLHLAVTLGLPAALLICGVLLVATVRATAWREASPVRQMAWTALAIVGLHSLLEYPLWYGPFQMAVALCLYFLWTTRKAEEMRPPGSVAIALCGTLAGLTLAGTAFVAWDYWRAGQLYLPVNERAAAYRENTLERVRNSWFFHNEVQFAYVTTTSPNSENAKELYAAALQSMHFSPEPRVIAAVLNSAALLSNSSSVVLQIQDRNRAVYGAER